MSFFQNKIIYFNSDINPEFDKGIFTLREPNNLKILELILEEPGNYLKLLENKSGIKLGDIRKIIEILLELNLINEPL